ncbi:MAG TPA: hypothetical protein PLU49_03390 [Saprospiraceae bacterium]|nr:hypothetical protein [Saprospirales bacterium]HRQ29092.1 hypothetical protein [Saprospiraceae bacterium]
MKRSFYYYFLSLFIIAGLFTACEPEPVEVISPEITLVKEAGFVYGDSILEVGQAFKVKVNVTKGTNDIKLIGIKENNVQLPLDRILEGMSANPALVFGTEIAGFTKEINLYAQQNGESEYTFYVEDIEGYTNAVKVKITEVVNDFEGVYDNLQVYNFSGPNFGTLDLHAAAAVGQNDTSGDIRDGGIDIGLPVPQNWKQIIFPVNGARLYKSSTAVDFNTINTKAKLKAAIESASNITASQKLQKGDIYFATTPSLTGSTTDFFMLKVDDIVLTEEDNKDFYLFSMKKALKM